MEAYALTDIGRVRTMNQDYIYSSPEKVGSLPNLFLVADGMGGHRAGDRASRLLIDSLTDYIGNCGDQTAVAALNNGIAEANRKIYEAAAADQSLSGMGTTLVAATIEGSTLYVANVGDSRLYLIHGDSIRQVTRDHSYVEEMVAIGQMRRGSEDYNRRKNIITRALGIGREVEPDFFEVDLEGGDYILLCSDGLSNMLEDQSMYEIITGEGSLKEKAALLIEEANRQGGIDNIAVVLVSPSGREAGVC